MSLVPPFRRTSGARFSRQKAGIIARAMHAPRTLAAMLALTLAASTLDARAHAIVVESSPRANETVATGTREVRLVFNSRIDATRSRATIDVPGRADVPLELVADSPTSVRATVVIDASGPCVLHWQVLALDGHITRGTIAFTAAAR